MLSGFIILYFLFSRPEATWAGRFLISFLIITTIPFLVVNGALTGSFTEQPVVVYNPDAHLGLRIGTVPVEDAVYNYALLLPITWLYEQFKSQGRLLRNG